MQLWHGLIALYFFISQVNCFAISQVPCVDISNSFSITGSVKDTVLFYGCRNTTAIFDLSSRTWETTPYPPLQSGLSTLYSEEAQAVFFVVSGKMYYYNVTEKFWGNAASISSTVFSTLYNQNTLMVLGTSDRLCVFDDVQNVQSYSQYTVISPGTGTGVSILANGVAYYISKSGSFNYYRLQGYRVSTNTVLPLQISVLNIPLGTGISEVFAINSKLIFLATDTDNTTVNVYETTTPSTRAKTFKLNVQFSSVNNIVAVAGNYAIFQIANANSPSQRFLYLYNGYPGDSFQALPGNGTPYPGGNYILVLSNTAASLFNSSTGQFTDLNMTKAVSAVYSQNMFYIVRDYSNSNFSVSTLNPDTLVISQEIFIKRFRLSQAFGLNNGAIFLFRNQSNYVDTLSFIPCTSHADCNDYCGGVEYCDNTGFCSPATANPCSICQTCNTTTSTCEDNPVGTVCGTVDACISLTCSITATCSDELNHCLPATSTSSSSSSSATTSTSSTTSSDSTSSTSSTSSSTSSDSTTGTNGTTEAFQTSTTTTTSTTSDSTSTNGDNLLKNTTSNSSSTTPIVASVVSIIGVILLLLLVFLVFRRYRNKRRDDSPPKSTDIEMPNAGMIKDVVIEKTLASGNFGDVYQGRMDGDVQVALKTLKASEYTLEFQREVTILRALNHPYIVRLYGVYEKENDKYMVFEFMPKGSLNRLLAAERSSIDYHTMLTMSLQIASGMKYLEANKIIHRDLALRNVLVTVDSTGNYIVKIGDFGMSRSVEGNYYRTDDKVVPIRWSAPEFIEFGTTTSKSDVYSFGVCLWELFTYGAIPWGGSSNSEVIQYVKEGKLLEKPSKCSQEMYELMVSCWSVEPNDRPSFEDIYKTISEMDRNQKTEVPTNINLFNIEDGTTYNA